MKIFELVDKRARSWALPLLAISLLVASPVALAGDLHDAARAGDLDRVQKLAVQGADVNARAVKDETPLMHAALAGQGDVVNYLLQRGAEIDARNAYGLTALHAAVYAGHTDIAVLLVDKGAEINDTANRFEVSPLMLASEENHIETVKALLHRGADITVTNHNGYSVTTEAGYREYWDMVRLLLANGAKCQPEEFVGEWLYTECTRRANAI